MGPHSIFSSRGRTRFNLLRLISNSVVADDLELPRFLSPPFKYWCTRHRSDFTPRERLHTQFMLSWGSNPGHHTGGKAPHQLSYSPVAFPHHPHATVSRECGLRKHGGPRQIMELWEILKWGSQQGLCAARTGLAAELGRPLTSV